MSRRLVPPPDRDLLRIREVAAALGLSERCVLNHVRDGHVDAIKTPGNHWRVPAAELQRLLASAGITSPTGAGGP